MKHIALLITLALVACSLEAENAPKGAPATSPSPAELLSAPAVDTKTGALGRLHTLGDLSRLGPITELRLNPGLNAEWAEDNGVARLTAGSFEKLLRAARPLAPDDKLFEAVSLAPWYDASFVSGGRKWSVALYLGGLGVITDDAGRRGAFKFDMSRASRPTEAATFPSGAPATQAVGKTIRYHLYWLVKKEPRVVVEYVDLLMSTEPVERLADVRFDANRPLPDAPAMVVTTYSKDSIWNVDGHPFKPVESISNVDLDKREMRLNGTQYQYASASLRDVVALLEKPEGTIRIHRVVAPQHEAEAFTEVLLARLKAQLRSLESKLPAGETETQPTGSRETRGALQ